MSDATSDTKYFDLHANGIGYLGRIRKVSPKRGQPFLACSINAFRGEAGSVEYVKFDVKCTGKHTAQIVGLLAPMVEAKKPVIVGFRIGDFYPDKYTIANGPKAGQEVISLKGRLLKIAFAKCDGQSIDLSAFAEAAPPDKAAA
jgi:hypothetical protein